MDTNTDDNSTDDNQHAALFNDPGPVTQATTPRANGGNPNANDDRARCPDATDVDGTDEAWEALADLTDSTKVRAYRSHTTRKRHRHPPCKHDITDVFEVNPDLVADVLRFAPDDHAAIHELIARREELEEHEYEVFTDTEDSDEERWHNIEQVAPVADIQDSTRRILTEEFDYDEQFGQ